jgi:transposase-like protein
MRAGKAPMEKGKPQRQYTDEQIVEILQEQASGVVPAKLVRHHSILINTLYRWRRKYTDMN